MDAGSLARILVTDRSLVLPEDRFVESVAESARRHGATLIFAGHLSNTTPLSAARRCGLGFGR